MGELLSFDRAPDLRSLFARALVNGRFSGTTVPDIRAQRVGVRLDVEHVVDYCKVCGFGVGASLPVTYPHVLGFPLQVAVMSRRDFPFSMLGLVHLENTVTWSRPLTLSDALDVTVHATNLRGHRRGRLIDLVTSVSVAGDRAENPVWRGVSTYLERGPGDEHAVTPPPPDVRVLRAGSGGAVWRVDAGAGRRYAAVSGDVNPIHLHPLTARVLGFDRAIAHGMYTYARALAVLGPRVPAAGTSSVWFRKPVTLPSTVRFRVAPDRRLAVLLPQQGDGEHLILTF